MFCTLNVVFSSQNDLDYDKLKSQLLDFNSNISFSPWREYKGLKNSGEFNCSLELSKEEIQNLLSFLNNDWDGPFDDCICFGFNTKMFNPLVYQLTFTAY